MTKYGNHTPEIDQTKVMYENYYVSKNSLLDKITM